MKNFSQRFVNNIIGGPKGPRMGGRRPKHDCHGRNMVKYNYFEYTNADSGQKGIEYAGSKIAAARILEDKGTRVVPGSVIQLSYHDAQEKLDLMQMNQLRKSTKTKYWNTGMPKDLEDRAPK